MDTTVDFHSGQNEPLLNPRMPVDQAKELLSWLSAASGLTGHVFILTSGSTAASVADYKWVALSKEAILASADGSNAHMKCNNTDVWLHCLPDFHVGGLGIWARAKLAGGRVVRLTSSWDAAAFAQAALESNATQASLVPTQVHDLVRLGHRPPSSLRAVLVGGGALSDSLYSSARELGWPLLRTYGMSEAASQVATEPLSGEARLKVLPHLEASADADGRLRVRGTSMLSGYVSLDAHGKPHLWDPKDREGWFVTEDYGAIEGGWLTVEGRAADRLKIGGETTNLQVLSKFLDDRIKGVTLLGVPDERLEWIVALVVEADVGPEAVSELVRRFNEAVLPFERIRRQFVVERIPRTELGKVKRAELLSLVSSP